MVFGVELMQDLTADAAIKACCTTSTLDHGALQYCVPARPQFAEHYLAVLPLTSKPPCQPLPQSSAYGFRLAPAKTNGQKVDVQACGWQRDSPWTRSMSYTQRTPPSSMAACRHCRPSGWGAATSMATQCATTSSSTPALSCPTLTPRAIPHRTTGRRRRSMMTGTAHTMPTKPLEPSSHVLRFLVHAMGTTTGIVICEGGWRWDTISRGD